MKPQPRWMRSVLEASARPLPALPWTRRKAPALTLRPGANVPADQAAATA